ncbi:bifunctional 2-polyprenyl-6-hydroxyphenol methylase/3-demethylubiquinol 3-O-methyltransferase UbiG [Ponticaulis sp.]|uniref:bifunctional 2-polyprenyl-6-hydroxyphenol methylase/3-demethylubiquinol 3-O-methyltransferase UbiG n=1 Tax=Ponticaulis sp. TaxID=2020902 RepID=UPI000B6CFEF6|nr:bifunctional 2-polyprenyl-6-hydroxyphenol methylase/3-demethylubiquinol 3-O-methyltransferase UbiG [Ponticaulis sp.]MAI90112.1 bifunctional 3-demethylubiquinol 3-O-methyltransferase/2-polyprenyl-6-hydroxyphenol methylase [Ponticaulis sp.]OUX99767.1 MAG: bifunctional 3-demethylubiquinol 3-O-methyltransferase/2-polyprenyl-6-hydroxyphenol methylase [Hyphomonadaceae bacterium TMED5]|tara:strand:+ start:72827 stop:73606 length:780 start_codon:yes stop_codon:yes gene_type:complete
MSENSLNEAPEGLISPSIDPEEVSKFSAIASEWWDPKGKFRPLHKFNPTRLRFLRETLVSHFDLNARAVRPLEGLRLLDIGCGGGLISEPMARLGASVTGVDASENNIKTAKVHAEQQGLSIDFRAGTAEALLASGEEKFDVVLNMEVIEHVADPETYLTDCCGLLKPGGVTVVATLNKTPKALALAVVGAEYVLGWLPRGTHDFSKFLKPEQITSWLEAAGLECEPAVGVSYKPLGDSWAVSSDTDVNYMIVARKPAG